MGLSNGADFGNCGFLRLNLGCTRSLLEKAIERMKTAFYAYLKKFIICQNLKAELHKLLKLHDEAYYRYGANISDQEYDRLKREFETIDQDEDPLGLFDDNMYTKKVVISMLGMID